MRSESFWREARSGNPPRRPISENGRYIFPYPVMAVVADIGQDLADVRVPTIPPPEHSLGINSLVLQPAIGCPWNRCLFCMQNKNKRFLPRPEQVKEDIVLAKKHYGDKPHHIFLADGNSFVLRTDKLIDIINCCYETFPQLERVSTYGSARFLLRKGLDELKLLSQAGLKKIYLGLESGDDKVLHYMNKGATSDEMIVAAKIARDAGIELSVTTLMGLGGTGSWKRNAEATANVLNQMKPPETRPHHLIIRPASPLAAKVAEGEFIEASRHEILKEERLLISLLNYETRLHLHRFMIPGLPIEKKLPEDKEQILGIIDFLLHRFFGEVVDPEKIEGLNISKVLAWDGYEDISPLDDVY